MGGVLVEVIVSSAICTYRLNLTSLAFADFATSLVQAAIEPTMAPPAHNIFYVPQVIVDD